MVEFFWLIVVVIAVLIELLTVGNLLFIWFAMGGIAAYISQHLGLSWEIQIIIFSIVTLISLVIIRPLTNNYLRGEVVSTNMDRMVGKQFRLDRDLTKDSWYQQKVEQDVWSIVESNRRPLSKGTLVEVIAIDGVKLVVKPLTLKEEQ